MSVTVYRVTHIEQGRIVEDRSVAFFDLMLHLTFITLVVSR